MPPPTPDSIARNPLEDAQQTAFFLWTVMQYPHFPLLRFAFAIPNGGKRDKITAARMKTQGVKPGVPDVMIPIPIVDSSGAIVWPGLWLELKKVGGKPSADQLEWQKHLVSMRYAHRICVGYVEMREAVKQYFGRNLPWRD